MKPIWIELVNTGVANRFEFEDYETVEMNWRLTMYPELYHNIYSHEIGHDNGKFTVHDFVHDMKSKTPGLFTFMRNHISSWTQVLPIYWDRGKGSVVYDWSNIISWIMLFATAYAIYLICGWIL